MRAMRLDARKRAKSGCRCGFTVTTAKRSRPTQKPSQTPAQPQNEPDSLRTVLTCALCLAGLSAVLWVVFGLHVGPFDGSALIADQIGPTGLLIGGFAMFVSMMAIIAFLDVLRVLLTPVK